MPSLDTNPTAITAANDSRAARPLAAGFNHAALVTADLDRLAAFYIAVFDAQRIDTPAPPGTRAVTVRLAGNAGLALMEVPGNPHGTGSPTMLARGHIDHVAIDVATAADLDEARRRLVAAGASDGEVHDYGPMLNVSFTDPDGMASEVCWLRDPTWTIPAHPPVPFTGTLADLDHTPD